MATKPDSNPKLTRRQAENARAAIQTAKLIQLLEQNATGKIELTAARVKSIQILLSKVLPDMQQVETVETEAPRTMDEIRAQLVELVKADPDLLAYLVEQTGQQPAQLSLVK